MQIGRKQYFHHFVSGSPAQSFGTSSHHAQRVRVSLLIVEL
jgi:hypothetical protein